MVWILLGPRGHKVVWILLGPRGHKVVWILLGPRGHKVVWIRPQHLCARWPGLDIASTSDVQSATTHDNR